MKLRFFTHPLVLLMVGAVLTAMTLVFPEIGFLQWITMIPLFIGVYRFCEQEHGSLKRAYGYGFFMIYAFYFVVYHWIVALYPLDFIGMDETTSALIVVVGWIGLPLLQAIPGGLLMLAMRILSKNGFFGRFPLLRPVVFASLWVIFEWCSTLTWAGVPWGRMALGQIELLPMVQSASLLGSYFVSWLLLLVNGLLAYGLLYRPKRLLCGSLAGGLLFANLCYGLIAQSINYEKDGNKIVAAVVQGNVDSHDKWGANSYNLTVEAYEKLTREAVAEGAELVVWPETVFPNLLNHHASLQSFVSSLAKECEITLLVGSLYKDSLGDTYNALYLVTPDGEICSEPYTKQRLVPFGEYVPMRELITTLIPPLGEISALDSDLTPGNQTILYESEWGTLGSLICFDSIYETLALDSVRKGAELMLISSNDNWFYDSAAVYQHQAQAQLRAIETGRYYVNASSTGISSIIAPDGELLAWIDPLVEGVELSEVYSRQTNTLYTIVGNLFVYLCMAFCAFLLFFEKPLRNYKSNKLDRKYT